MLEQPPRLPNPIYPALPDVDGDLLTCEICGEYADSEMGEFGIPDSIRTPDTPISVYAHAQCGLDHGLDIA